MLDLVASYALKGIGALLVLLSAFMEGIEFPALLCTWALAVAIGYSATILAVKARRER